LVEILGSQQADLSLVVPMNVWILLLGMNTIVVLDDFASVVSSPPPAITVASKLIKNYLGSDSPSNVGIMLNLYPIGH
jgi:hypothetical protein